MTALGEKSAPKGEEFRRIGREPDAGERFLAWLRGYATFLSIAGLLVLVVIGMNTLVWEMTSTRFDDTAARIDDTKAEAGRIETRLSKQIEDVKTEVGSVEVRIGRRIDDIKTELRDARQERKMDLHALRQDLQGLRHDISNQRDHAGTTN